MEQEPHKESKVTRAQQMKGSIEGTGSKVVADQCFRVFAWSPSLVLDGAPLLFYFSVRDFQ